MLVEGATFPPCLYCIRQCTCILSGHAATMCQCIGDDIASHISHFPCCTGTSLDFAVIYFQSWFCLHLTVCTSLSKHFYPMDTAYDSSLYVFSGLACTHQINKHICSGHALLWRCLRPFGMHGAAGLRCTHHVVCFSCLLSLIWEGGSLSLH